jgi:hypothetical protein
MRPCSGFWKLDVVVDSPTSPPVVSECSSRLDISIRCVRWISWCTPRFDEFCPVLLSPVISDDALHGSALNWCPHYQVWRALDRCKWQTMSVMHRDHHLHPPPQGSSRRSVPVQDGKWQCLVHYLSKTLVFCRSQWEHHCLHTSDRKLWSPTSYRRQAKYSCTLNSPYLHVYKNIWRQTEKWVRVSRTNGWLSVWITTDLSLCRG